MKDYSETEKQVKEIFEEKKCESFQEIMNEIRPTMIKKNQRVRKKSKKNFIARIAAVAASFILLFGIGFGVLLYLNKDPGYRYEDGDISLIDVNDTTLLETPNLFVPNLSIFSEKNIKAGKHKVSNENVYFVIVGIQEDDLYFREIELYIVLQPKYDFKNNENYSKGEGILISDIKFFYYETEYLEPFYRYNIGFKVNEIKYYINYSTIEQGDVQEFMSIFLTKQLL